MGKIDDLKKEYWKVLSRTRQSGRISQSVKDKQEEYWSGFDEDVVEEALRIHISRYPDYKETYTRGIMRNLQIKKEKTGKAGTSNDFNNFEQNSYDFDKLEKALVGN